MAINDEMTIQEGLDEYLKSHDFGDSTGGYEDDYVTISAGTPLKLKIKNLQARKDASEFHDIGHLLTGYPPQNFAGEIQQAAFEIGCGCGKYWFAWFINGLASPMIFFYPIKMSKAFIRGLKSKSIYKLNLDEIKR